MKVWESMTFVCFCLVKHREQCQYLLPASLPIHQVSCINIKHMCYFYINILLLTDFEIPLQIPILFSVESNNIRDSIRTECFSFNIIDDDVVEEVETATFDLVIHDPQVVIQSTASNAVVSIEDDDSTCYLFSSATWPSLSMHSELCAFFIAYSCGNRI